MSTSPFFDIGFKWVTARLFAAPKVGRGILMGVGSAYCFAEKKKIHLPIALLAPGLYCGAVIYMEWDELVKESKAVVEGTKIMAQREKEIITTGQ